jgi:hypothetical protein
VEYPAGQPRWAVSHTLLAYPVADHTLHTHEYTWDMVHGHLQTHFRRYILLEQGRTDSRTGRTVRVQNRPISRTIEGNVQYPLPNSAVRGVWADPQRTSANLYTRRLTQLMPMHNGVYAIAPHAPVTQCYGLWTLEPEDPADELFDGDTGLCRDRARLIEQCRIPLDEPKLGMLDMVFRTVHSNVYGGDIQMLNRPEATVDEHHLARLRQRLGTKYSQGQVGYAGKRGHAPDDLLHCHGYCPAFDLNGDGVIDAEDEERLARHLGRTVRYNLYFDAYFGGDWLSTTICTDPEHRPGVPIVADYEYGAGYDAEAGIVRLFETPGPDRPVWVEYHCDAPAEPGENNIIVHLYREVQP